MALITIHPGLTPRILQRLQLIIKIPELAFLRLITIFKRIPPKILYIVCIHTKPTLMTLRVRAPYRLVFLEVEIVVLVQQVDHLNFYLGLGVSECTEFFVLAFYVFVRVSFAEFWFVTAGMVYLFDLIMRKMTFLVITFGPRTQLMAIIIKIGPASITIIMIVHTSLPLMKIYITHNILTSPRTGLGLMRPYIKPKKLSILKNLLLLTMQIRTQ